MRFVPLATRPDPPPLATDDVRLVGFGTLAFAVALVVLAGARLAGAGVQSWWLAMCAEGTVLGVVGVGYCRRRRDARTRPRP